MPGPSPYPWLEPDIWRSLLIRAAMFHAVRGQLARLCDLADHVPVVRSVLDEFTEQAREPSFDEDDLTAVIRIARAWIQVIERKLRLQALDDEAREVLTDLRGSVESVEATDPFPGLLLAIEARARSLYGQAWRSVRLSVRHCNSHPRGQGIDPRQDPYTVTARTPWPPQPDAAEVELEVYCDEFGPAAYAAIPLLLAHECVCHVPARQDKVRNSSIFAEGLLDWVAHYFLVQWAGQIDPDLAPAARLHANRLMQILTAGAQTKEKAARLRGHRAAEILLGWFERECGLSRDESCTRVARLAVELNRVDNVLAAKDHFVSRISQPLPPDLAEALRSWVAEELSSDRLLTSAVGVP